MYTITMEFFQGKLKEHEYEGVNEEGEPITRTCPNGIIKESGKPDIVWAQYNGRTYRWELVE